MRTIPNYRLFSDPDTDLSIERVHVDDLTQSLPLHDYKIPPHRHDDLLHIVYLRQGGGSVYLEENEHSLTSPSLMVIPPSAVHSFSLSTGTKGELITITANYADSLFGGVPSLLELIYQPLVVNKYGNVDFLTLLGKLFDQLKQEYNSREPARSFLIVNKLSEIFVKVLRNQMGKDLGNTTTQTFEPAQQYYRQLHAYVGKNLSKKLSVNDCARHLKITATHLNRVCRMVSEKSALTVIHERIIAESKRSLLYTVLSVADVGYQLGFNDPSYFSKFFKAQTGQNPRDYRVQYRHCIEESSLKRI